MSIRQVILPASVSVAIILAASLFSATNASAEECPPGTRPATAGDAAVKNGQIEVGRCYKPDEVGIGQNAEEAKQYLQSIQRGGTCGPYTSTANQLDAKFAICAARFLKDARAKDSNIRVVSMYRSEAHQAYLCGGGCGRVNGPCARPGQSNHQGGRAIDISNGQHILPSWIPAMARGYGIQFPVRNDSGHMEPIPGSNCADPNFRPTDTVGNLTPGGTLSDQIRRALGMQPPPPPQPPMAPQPQLPPQPQSQPQPSLPAQPTLPGQPNISSEYPQPNPVSNLINTNTNTSNNTNTNKASSTATSTWDLIEAYLNPVSDSIDIGRAVDIALNPDTSDVTSLDANRPTSTLLNATGTLTMYQPPNTFTSSDLAKNPIVSSVSGQNTFVLQILETMKNTLLLALNYLRPFGGRTPAQGYGE